MRQPSPPKHVRARSEARRTRLWALGYRSYRDYLASSHWQSVKARYRASDLPQDCICGEDDVHLHHMTYERIGAEDLEDLTPLCRNCHALIHVLEARGEIGLDFAGFQDADRARIGRQLLSAAAAQRDAEAERARAEIEAELLAMPLASRLMRVVDHARVRRMNISHQLHLIRKIAERRNGPHLNRRLALLEEKVYGWDGWTMRCMNAAPEQREAA